MMTRALGKLALGEARATLEAVIQDHEADLALILTKSHTPNPVGNFVVGPGLLVEQPSSPGFWRIEASFVLWDSADSPGFRMPYRARVVEEAFWRVESIESQCPSCLGTGILEYDERPCDTCGAVGWGLREVLARTDEPTEEDAPVRELAVTA